MPLPSLCLVKQALTVERILGIKLCGILMVALDVQHKAEHVHGIYINSLCYISYHMLVVQEMTSLNSKICWAPGGQVVKH